MSHRWQPRPPDPTLAPTRLLLLVLLVATIAPAAGATDRQVEPATTSPAISVIVPVEPYVLTIDRIAGDRVDVHTLVPAGRSPHTYSPTPQQIAALAEADVLFHVGLELEQGLVPKLRELGEDLLVVELMPSEPGTQDAGGHVHDHESGHDPHVWLDPDSMIEQVTLIAETLAQMDPAGAELYAAGLDSLVRDLASLDEELASQLEPHAGSRFYVFHPAYGHFAEAYDLEQVAIETDGKEPSAKRLAALMDMARSESVSIIITQPQHSDATVRTLAVGIGAEIVSIDPLAHDLFATLSALADAVAPDSSIAPDAENELP